MVCLGDPVFRPEALLDRSRGEKDKPKEKPRLAIKDEPKEEKPKLVLKPRLEVKPRPKQKSSSAKPKDDEAEEEKRVPKGDIAGEMREFITKDFYTRDKVWGQVEKM